MTDIDSTVNLLRCNENISVGDFVVRNEEDLLLLSHLTTITGQIIVEETGLTSLGTDHCLVEAGGLVVKDNPRLLSITGFDDLELIFDDVLISGNEELATLETFGRLTKVMGALEISDNPSLTSLSGLESLERLGGDLLLSSNRSLESSEGIDGLITVTGNFSVVDNESLEDLSGFRSLFYVDGDLSVHRNKSLERLELVSLSYVNRRLCIYMNESLPTCEVDMLWAQMGDGEFVTNRAVNENDENGVCD